MRAPSITPRSYRLRVAARRLGTTAPFLRRRLSQMGGLVRDGITGRHRAAVSWVQRGLLIEVQRQYFHPVTGLNWYVRIEITPDGLDYLRSTIHHSAA